MVEAKDNPVAATTALKKRIKREPPPQQQQQHNKRTTIGIIDNVKQEIPWNDYNNVDDDDDYQNVSDNDNDVNKNSEIVYMEEEEEDRQLTHDEIAEYLEFVPEDGEQREGVWSEIFKTEKDGVEFKVMHVKPIANDISDGKLSTIVEEKEGETKKQRSPNKRGPYKKGPKTPKMCQLCGNTYRNQSLLDGHMRRHMNDRPFECQ